MKATFFLGILNKKQEQEQKHDKNRNKNETKTQTRMQTRKQIIEQGQNTNLDKLQRKKRIG